MCRRYRSPIRKRLLLALALGGSALFLVALFFWFTTPLPTADQLRTRAALGNTRILDRHGQLIFQLTDPLSGRKQPVALTAIPLALQQATVAVEDASFYQNMGLDLRGMLRAFWANLQAGQIMAGGSTISQQLARNFLFEPGVAQQRTLVRKLREAVLALKLTMTLPKGEILALYLNQVYYGGTSYGVDAAAWRIFGKPVRDLSLAEAALLAGLPQAPAYYDPFVDPAAARARQSLVLDAMVRTGFLAPDQADAARHEPLRFVGVDPAIPAPHFVTYVIEQLGQTLGPDRLLRGGLTITTTLDVDLQSAAEASLRRQLARLTDTSDDGMDHAAHNGAVVVLDPADGAILALVGSPDFTNSAIDGQVNAALALRQPGSALKPLTYAAAFEQGWTPASTLLDIPSAFTTREGSVYTPNNYDQAFHGPLSLREALATSSNVAAVRLLDAIGIPALLDMTKRLGIRSLNPQSSRYGLALTLGGGEVTLLELTAAYGAFANGGQRITPYAILAVSDAAIAHTAPSPDPVLSPQVAYLITDILADRYARSRAFGEASALDLERPAAVKTGTSSDWRDNWTVGYTPDRVAGVWVGNADGRPMRAVTGVTGAAPVWNEVMQAANRDQPARDFVRPAGIVELMVCAEGGLLPGPNCPSTRRERFIAGTQPTRADDSHITVALDPLLDCRVPPGYPANRTVRRIFRLLPAEAEPWARQAGVPRPPRTMCTPLSAAQVGGTAPVSTAEPLAPVPNACQAQRTCLLITSPARGAHFARSPNIPPERQQIAIEAAVGGEVTQVTITLDDRLLATMTHSPYRILWELAPGTHRIAVMARAGDGTVLRGEVVEITVE